MHCNVSNCWTSFPPLFGQYLHSNFLSRAARIKAAALKLAKINQAWLRGEGKEELRKLSQDLFIELL